MIDKSGNQGLENAGLDETERQLFWENERLNALLAKMASKEGT